MVSTLGHALTWSNLLSLSHVQRLSRYTTLKSMLDAQRLASLNKDTEPQGTQGLDFQVERFRA